MEIPKDYEIQALNLLKQGLPSLEDAYQLFVECSLDEKADTVGMAIDCIKVLLGALKPDNINDLMLEKDMTRALRLIATKQYPGWHGDHVAGFLREIAKDVLTKHGINPESQRHCIQCQITIQAEAYFVPTGLDCFKYPCCSPDCVDAYLESEGSTDEQKN
jgi:hypothetical protein